MSVKNLLLALLILLTLILTSQTVLAATQTVEVELTPSFDTYIDSDGTFHNTSTFLQAVGRWTATLTPRFALEFDTSPIHDSANISYLNLSYYVTEDQMDWDSYARLTQLTNQPSSTAFSTLWSDIYEDDDDDCYTWRWDSGIAVGEETHSFSYPSTIITDLLSNINNDWFGIGGYAHSQYNFRTGDYSIASSENPTYDPMTLTLTYDVNAPILSSPSPASSSTNSIIEPTVCINLSHPSGLTSNLTFQWFNSTTWESFGTNTSCSNGTYCHTFSNASEIATTYTWRVIGYDTASNWTNNASYTFTTTNLFPPSDISCSRNNATSVNLTWTKCPNGTGVAHTLVYYSLGYTAPNYLSGILAANTTGSSITVSDLGESSCYSFALYTNYNDSGTWSLSTRNVHSPCCTAGGEYSFAFRYENSSFSDDGDGIREPTDFYNNYINLSHYNCSTHRLTIHYVDYSTQYFDITPTWFEAPTGGNYLPIFNVTLIKDPLYFELHWNHTLLSTGTCTCNYTNSYTRILLPNSATTADNRSLITFYLITDRHIYNDYYIDDSTGGCNESIEYLYQNNLAHYSLWFEDRTTLFSSRLNYNAYASIFIYNATNEKLYIHQQYFDSNAIITPTLLYNKDYGIGVNCSVTDNRYQSIGYFRGDTEVSPSQETITILPIYEEQPSTEYFTTDFGWTDAGLLWFYFLDNSNGATNITLRVYDSDDNLVYSEYQNSNEVNFTALSTNYTQSYSINLTIEHQSFGTLYIQFVTGTYYAAVTSATEINTIFYSIFGNLPANTDTGVRMQWWAIPLFFIGLIPLSLFGAVSPPLGALSVGIWMTGYAAIVSGIPIELAAMGAFLIFFGVIMFYISRRQTGGF